MCLLCKKPVKRYQDTGDYASTGNITAHAKKCFGAGVVAKFREHAKSYSVSELWTLATDERIRTPRIDDLFTRMAQEQQSFFIHPYTQDEYNAETVMWVSEDSRPFEVVQDRSYRWQIREGRPYMEVLHPKALGRWVRKAFAYVRRKVVAKKLQVS